MPSDELFDDASANFLRPGFKIDAIPVCKNTILSVNSKDSVTGGAPSKKTIQMPKKKPTSKKPALKLSDLTPKKDARGGHASYSNNAPLSIPPPGFISSHENRTPDRRR